jgi:ankyrin repeat protein
MLFLTRDIDKKLYVAAQANHVAACRAALDEGADQNARHEASTSRMSILACAIKAKATEAALLLIEHGANVAPVVGTSVPLICAATAGNAQVCRALTARGANVNTRSDDGRTALHAAAAGLHLEVCRDLIVLGADLLTVDAYGRAALHLLTLNTPRPRVFDMMRLLIEAGASPDYVPASTVEYAEYLTPFQYAVRQRRKESVAFFLFECNVGPSQRTIDGRTMPELTTNEGLKEMLRSAVTRRTVSNCVEREGIDAQSAVSASAGARPLSMPAPPLDRYKACHP